jgi:23S rRNA (cytidine1920-2'-O)/16S rRNA (cytidine1409-2'-O)-methyltransferase
MAKLRLDKLLVERGLIPSRERAASLILAGRVLVNEQKQTKAGSAVDPEANVRILGEEMPFVSRGGLKLRGALSHWGIDLAGKLCCDIGASTGGFTDCMLQAGAVGVLAVDTGYGQLAMTLRNDPRVRLLERTNARLLAAGALLPETAKIVAQNGVDPHPAENQSIRFFAMDVSFISASIVLPAVVGALAPEGSQWSGELVTLVKPQFEAGREWVGKGGIVRDPAAYTVAIDRVRDTVKAMGGETIGVIDSPITGMEGNREFLLYARFV